MSTSNTITTWADAAARLRAYEPAGPEAIAAEMVAARIAGRRTRRNFTLLCLTTLATSAGFAWAWLPTSDPFRLAILTMMCLASVSAVISLLSTLVSAAGPTFEEKVVEMKYEAANGADWDFARQLVEDCPEAREAVAGWMQRLPHLRRAEMDVLVAVHPHWTVEQARRRTMQAVALQAA